MTKEELEDKAEEYADKQIGCGDGYYEWTDVEQAYLAGAEPREKRIAELEAQIEKLQNCWNCKKSFSKSCSFGKKCEADKKKCKDWDSTFD